MDRTGATLAISETLYLFCYAIDACDGDGFAGCFTDDGVLEFFDQRLVGRETLRTYAAERARVAKRHITTMPIATISGSRATSQSVLTIVTDTPAGPVITTLGRFEDELVECNDGRWQLERRRVHIESRIELP